mgnify:CR=1 FL=1
MSRRNTAGPSCGKKGRANILGGPPGGGVLVIPRCSCGTVPVLDTTPPKNRKPAVAPDGHRRRAKTLEEWAEENRLAGRDALTRPRDP